MAKSCGETPSPVKRPDTMEPNISNTEKNASLESFASAPETIKSNISINEKNATPEMFATAPDIRESDISNDEENAALVTVVFAPKTVKSVTSNSEKVTSTPDTMKSNISNNEENTSLEIGASDTIISNNEENAALEIVASDTIISNNEENAALEIVASDTIISNNEENASLEIVASGPMKSNTSNNEENASLDIIECKDDEIYDPEYNPVKTHVNKWNVCENEKEILPKTCLELVPREVMVAVWIERFNHGTQEVPGDIPSTSQKIPKENIEVPVRPQGATRKNYVNKRNNAEKPIESKPKKKVRLYSARSDDTIIILDEMEREVPLQGEFSKKCSLERVDLYCDSSNDTVLVPDEIITQKPSNAQPSTSRDHMSPILGCFKNITNRPKMNQKKRLEVVEKDLAEGIGVRKTTKKVESTPKKTSSVDIEDSDEDVEVCRTKKKTTPTRKVYVAKGSEYTHKENKLLCKYAFKNKIYERHVSGNVIWKELENENIIPGRSWQSLRARFLVLEKTRGFTRYMEPEKATLMIEKLQEMRAEMRAHQNHKRQ